MPDTPFCDAHLHLSDVVPAPVEPVETRGAGAALGAGSTDVSGNRSCSTGVTCGAGATLGAGSLAFVEPVGTREAGTALAPTFPPHPLCTSVHSPEDAARLFDASGRCVLGARQVVSMGVHPQNPDARLLGFVEQCLKNAALPVAAVGECGFDFFTPKFRATEAAQTEVWAAQLELARRYGKTLVVHVRKALPRLFADARALAALPAVVFHSFPGSPVEAEGFLRRGVNAYFSFGKPLLNGNKRARQCVAVLPAERLLLETDAPFQTLRNEPRTLPGDIERVYTKAWHLRGEHRAAPSLQMRGKLALQMRGGECSGRGESSWAVFRAQLYENFCRAYGVVSN